MYASDAYTLPGNTAVLTCLVLPSDQAWAAEVTHWTISPPTSSPAHLVDAQQTVQSILYLSKNIYFFDCYGNRSRILAILQSNHLT